MNKALCILFAAALLCSSASAQITKGSKLLGGSISGYANNQKNNLGFSTKQRGYDISPSLGFVLKDNEVLGFYAGYGKVNNGQKRYSVQAGLFYRKYLPLAKSFHLFGEGGLYYTRGEEKYLDQGQASYKTKFSGAGLYVQPGIAYSVTKKLFLEATVSNLLNFNYQFADRRYQTGNLREKTNNFSFQSNVTSSAPFSVGFRFLLGK